MILIKCLVVILLACPTLIGFVAMLHLKRNVYVEHLVMSVLIKKMRGHLRYHTHPLNPQYRQCHRSVGIGYLWDSAYSKDQIRDGFLEGHLPQTIRSDFEFLRALKPKKIANCIKEILSAKGFQVSEDLVHKKKMKALVAYQLLHPKKKIRLSLCLFRLPGTMSHRRYRLVTTWLS